MVETPIVVFAQDVEIDPKPTIKNLIFFIALPSFPQNIEGLTLVVLIRSTSAEANAKAILGFDFIDPDQKTLVSGALPIKYEPPMSLHGPAFGWVKVPLQGPIEKPGIYKAVVSINGRETGYAEVEFLIPLT